MFENGLVMCLSRKGFIAYVLRDKLCFYKKLTLHSGVLQCGMVHRSSLKFRFSGTNASYPLHLYWAYWLAIVAIHRFLIEGLGCVRRLRAEKWPQWRSSPRAVTVHPQCAAVRLEINQPP
jgi:hypothetical protein